MVGHKAWEFSETPRGGTAIVQLRSLVAIAKVNREPYSRLNQVMVRLPQAESVVDYAALLPENCLLEIPHSTGIHLAVDVLRGSHTLYGLLSTEEFGPRTSYPLSVFKLGSWSAMEC